MPTTEYDTTATLVWPAIYDAVELPDPHVTILYMGEFADLNTAPEELQKVLRQFAIAPGEVPISNLSIFGDENKVVVAELALPEDFRTLREMIKEETIRAGGRDASSYPDYKPHVTLRKAVEGETLPGAVEGTVTLLAPQLWWGEDYLDLR